ncbi:hypothetical protein [Burkholderia multivorans]|uniref:hypothetical protein n=1 Tax=Burkholderia multivorans TaxID=87883 RepID=UPI001C613F1D
MILVTGGAGFTGANLVRDRLSRSDAAGLDLDESIYARNLRTPPLPRAEAKHRFAPADPDLRTGTRCATSSQADRCSDKGQSVDVAGGHDCLYGGSVHEKQYGDSNGRRIWSDEIASRASSRTVLHRTTRTDEPRIRVHTTPRRARPRGMASPR